jgi:type IV secretory pathway VirB6-like protein
MLSFVCYNRIMIQAFKKFFIRLGKKLLLASFGLFILGILFTPQPALAGIWDWIVGAVTFLPSLFINLILQLLILLLGSLASLAGTLLKWVLSPGFISWSYTNPANNPVIEVGYNITRSFVNMGLVLALVYIAFATILRLAGYKAQKLLATLILVALLVNFAPVICGLIVDASNIVMYYFTDHITGMKHLTNTLVEVGQSLKASFTSVEVTKQMGVIFQSVVLIFFNVALLFILLAFVVLFILRYVAIWILVILSPLAFVSRVLPATKKMFDMWWKQLIQWSIIGIIAGFFIYLGEQIATALSDPNVIGVKIETEYGLFDRVLPHMVTLAFLVIGFFLSLTTGAMGADAILKAGGAAAMAGGAAVGKGMKTIGTKVGVGTLKWEGGRAGAGAKFVGRAIPAPIRELPGKIGEKATAFSKNIRTAGGKVAAATGLKNAWDWTKTKTAPTVAWTKKKAGPAVARLIDLEGIKKGIKTGSKSAWEGKISKKDAPGIKIMEDEMKSKQEELGMLRKEPISDLARITVLNMEINAASKKIAEKKRGAEHVGGLSQAAKEFIKAPWAAALKEIKDKAKISTPKKEDKAEKMGGDIKKMKEKLKKMEEKGNV